MSDQKRTVSSQLVNITPCNVSRLQIRRARRANTTQSTPCTATSGQSRETILLSQCQYSHFWHGLCQEAFDLSEPSNKIRCLCTGLSTTPGSSRYIRPTAVLDGYQLGKCTELHLSQVLLPLELQKSMVTRHLFSLAEPMLSQTFHNLDYPRPSDPLKKTALAMQPH